MRSLLCFYLADMFVFTFPSVGPKTIILPRLNSELSSIQMIIRAAMHSKRGVQPVKDLHKREQVAVRPKAALWKKRKGTPR